MKNLPFFLSLTGLLVTALIGGSTYFIIKGMLSQINPLTLVAYRFSVATLIFAGCVFLQREKFWFQFHHGLLLGCLLWVQFILITVGEKYTTASNSAFITGLYILFIPVIEYLFLRKKPKLVQIIALGITIAGLWLLTGGLKGMNYGDLLTLGAAVGFGFYMLLINKAAKDNRNMFVLNFQQFFSATLLGFLSILVFRLPLSIGEPNILLSLLYLGVFANAIAYGLLLLCQKHVTPLTSSLILSIEPVFAALFAWTLGNETFILIRAIGGLFIILSIIICRLEK